ncbi:hypothetical protein M948_18035 [Virgibacillus sp. CM-4]|uniref:hypothetical protein n=1 Tax=Virgibacillus sp. CM-4 TaxID=1354277 RepID=UPI00038884E5|nr:hypothetical protein [Virgibacillus sp. CM-4]EQB35007.1 hypothetical protein M948_18035 [Virgibacillus sp. CM-4]
MSEMVPYCSGKTFGGQVPGYVLEVSLIFSRYELEVDGEGNFQVNVPDKELFIVNKFKDDVSKMLSEIYKVDSELAKKLARQYQFKLQKLI